MTRSRWHHARRVSERVRREGARRARGRRRPAHARGRDRGRGRRCCPTLADVGAPYGGTCLRIPV
eukprot:3431791-Prymnesium_polylepis.1